MLLKDNPIHSNISLSQRIILIISGLSCAIIILEIGLRLGGFIFLSLQEYRNRADIYKKGIYRIMCLGESTTACGDQDSYPSQLEKILNQRNIGIKFKVFNKGAVAFNTLDILAHLEDNLRTYRPDMVITMMGINDGQIKYYEGIPDANTAIFRNFRTYRLTRMIWMHIVNKINETSASEAIPNKDESKEKISTQKDFVENEGLSRKPIELNFKYDSDYFHLGWLYKERGNYAQAEEAFKKAIKLNPGSDRLYVELGKLYSEQTKHTQAEESFKKAILINPRNDEAYTRLGWSYNEQVRRAEGEEQFRKAVELNPRNDLAHVGLAFAYKDKADYIQAEESFKKAIEINPANTMAYVWLGGIYEIQGKYSQADEVFKKAIYFYPKGDGLLSDKLYGELAVLYQKIGKYREADEYYKKANKLRLEYYNPITRQNYQKLKGILDKRGVKLVCVQYPVRSIDSLKRMFKEQDGVIFVDNEKIFKEALRKASYKEYFIDTFGGEFGHCTPKGNRLLAENIATAILKEYFSK